MLAVMGALSAMGLSTPTARATFHEWKISEVYSNSSGSIQFIELQLPPLVFDDERFLSGHTIAESASGNTFTFLTNLPSTPVANQTFLIATPGYAALSGVPAADYLLPSNNWFSTSGDTFNYAAVDTLTFTNGQLPVDGTLSLQRASFGSTTLITAANSPTNFAGESGVVAVPEPTVLELTAIGAGLCLITRRRSREQVLYCSLKA
jgi:hypothetical protein